MTLNFPTAFILILGGLPSIFPAIAENVFDIYTGSCFCTPSILPTKFTVITIY